jgi:hypothetical protein
MHLYYTIINKYLYKNLDLLKKIIINNFNNMHNEITLIQYNIQTQNDKNLYKINNYLIKVKNLYELLNLATEYTYYQIKNYDLSENLIEKMYKYKINVSEIFKLKINYLVLKISELKKLNQFYHNNIIDITYNINKRIIFNIFSEQVMRESYWKRFYCFSKLRKLYLNSGKIEKLFTDITKYVFGYEYQFKIIIPQFHKIDKLILNEIKNINDINNIL